MIRGCPVSNSKSPLPLALPFLYAHVANSCTASQCSMLPPALTTWPLLGPHPEVESCWLARPLLSQRGTLYPNSVRWKWDKHGDQADGISSTWPLMTLLGNPRSVLGLGSAWESKPGPQPLVSPPGNCTGRLTQTPCHQLASGLAFAAGS